MHINVRHTEDVTILRLEGDFLCEPDQMKLRRRVSDLVAGGQNQVVVDLGNLKYINSCGLGSLICALTTLRKAGGDLRLAGVGEEVAGLLRITHLDRVFQISGTVDEAAGELHPASH